MNILTSSFQLSLLYSEMPSSLILIKPTSLIIYLCKVTEFPRMQNLLCDSVVIILSNDQIIQINFPVILGIISESRSQASFFHAESYNDAERPCSHDSCSTNIIHYIITPI